MSGFDGIGGPISPGGSCESLVIDTLLASPRQTVVANLSPGDVLDVRLAETSTGERVVEVVFRKQLAGGLASPAISRLRECIEGGTQYQARVTGKRDALVRVRVTAIRQ
ncbi:MAG: hypothetical protein Q7K57_32845 [Burkholderiaceae bacterium]|nr:hypothetical protein [Burkholderiaceae bacterium]